VRSADVQSAEQELLPRGIAPCGVKQRSQCSVMLQTAEIGDRMSGRHLATPASKAAVRYGSKAPFIPGDTSLPIGSSLSLGCGRRP
jgi:hypothetical protein